MRRFAKQNQLILLTVLLLLTLCSCGAKKQAEEEGAELHEDDPNAAAHEQLIAETLDLVALARQQTDAGFEIQGEYVYGMAQAEVSSLRLCIDTTLWLKGEGADLAEVIGDAPYGKWQEIVSAGPGSGVPFYFEGLLLTFQGKDNEAAECYKRASQNPQYKERDFYYLRNLSVEELYTIRERAASLEKEIYAEYTPRTALVEERTGEEYSPDYHLALAQKLAKEQPDAAYQCAVNALCVCPIAPVLYSTAAIYAMDAGKPDEAFEFVNEGLYLYPEDGELNYTAALLCFVDDDKTTAKSFLETAKSGADEALSARINALSAQMGE